MRLASKEMKLQQVLQEAIARHGDTRDALIPLLAEINQAFGYIPVETLGELRRSINDPEAGLFLADSQLFAIASFYHMFSLSEVGQHVIRFCESAPCHVAGGRQVIQAIQETLGIQPGQTTPDHRWTLLKVSCLGV